MAPALIVGAMAGGPIGLAAIGGVAAVAAAEFMGTRRDRNGSLAEIGRPSEVVLKALEHIDETGAGAPADPTGKPPPRWTPPPRMTADRSGATCRRRQRRRDLRMVTDGKLEALHSVPIFSDLKPTNSARSSSSRPRWICPPDGC
jgi:hypothetical protein